MGTCSRLSLIFLGSLCLGACQDKPHGPAAPDVKAFDLPEYEAIRIPDPEFDTKGNRVYMAEELSSNPIERYDQFPKKVAILMQHWVIEHGWCRGGSGNYPETYHACNRREILGLKIERMGYCWGAPIPDPAEFQRIWIKCTEQPGYHYPGGKTSPLPCFLSGAELNFPGARKLIEALMA
jgi:hypothetical protein